MAPHCLAVPTLTESSRKINNEFHTWNQIFMCLIFYEAYDKIVGSDVTC